MPIQVLILTYPFLHLLQPSDGLHQRRDLPNGDVMRSATQMERVPPPTTRGEHVVFQIVADEQNFRGVKLQSCFDGGVKLTGRLGPADF